MVFELPSRQPGASTYVVGAERCDTTIRSIIASLASLIGTRASIPPQTPHSRAPQTRARLSKPLEDPKRIQGKKYATPHTGPRVGARHPQGRQAGGAVEATVKGSVSFVGEGAGLIRRGKGIVGEVIRRSVGGVDNADHPPDTQLKQLWAPSTSPLPPLPSPPQPDGVAPSADTACTAELAHAEDSQESEEAPHRVEADSREAEVEGSRDSPTIANFDEEARENFPESDDARDRSEEQFTPEASQAGNPACSDAVSASVTARQDSDTTWAPSVPTVVEPIADAAPRPSSIHAPLLNLDPPAIGHEDSKATLFVSADSAVWTTTGWSTPLDSTRVSFYYDVDEQEEDAHRGFGPMGTLRRFLRGTRSRMVQIAHNMQKTTEPTIRLDGRPDDTATDEEWAKYLTKTRLMLPPTPDARLSETLAGLREIYAWLVPNRTHVELFFSPLLECGHWDAVRGWLARAAEKKGDAAVGFVWYESGPKRLEKATSLLDSALRVRTFVRGKHAAGTCPASMIGRHLESYMQSSVIHGEKEGRGQEDTKGMSD
ncbi:hypothetical protein BDK51DRAFT_43793 [Blyttiomyces helicus]|uniref:Uncharacterized protein n=1 Tax=Blyttiomyces helicus TaxID=388810 RepID=A0A4P9WGJ2_9FUNG|nr:hypothetical protein BDK51DRAFT_43793 [Blyttiomyces helicus]|eukprot:RKO90488.1 hypothetical protein BDK51DRAFT_43793 [Blyttiomyces helicus]